MQGAWQAQQQQAQQQQQRRPSQSGSPVQLPALPVQGMMSPNQYLQNPQLAGYPQFSNVPQMSGMNASPIAQYNVRFGNDFLVLNAV